MNILIEESSSANRHSVIQGSPRKYNDKQSCLNVIQYGGTKSLYENLPILTFVGGRFSHCLGLSCVQIYFAIPSWTLCKVNGQYDHFLSSVGHSVQLLRRCLIAFLLCVPRRHSGVSSSLRSSLHRTSKMGFTERLQLYFFVFFFGREFRCLNDSESATASIKFLKVLFEPVMRERQVGLRTVSQLPGGGRWHRARGILQTYDFR